MNILNFAQDKWLLSGDGRIYGSQQVAVPVCKTDHANRTSISQYKKFMFSELCRSFPALFRVAIKGTTFGVIGESEAIEFSQSSFFETPKIGIFV